MGWKKLDKAEVGDIIRFTCMNKDIGDTDVVLKITKILDSKSGYYDSIIIMSNDSSHSIGISQRCFITEKGQKDWKLQKL